MVVTLSQQYNTREKHTVVMLLVIGKEKIFTLYNESTEIFYDVYSETVVSSTKYSTQFTQLVFQVPAGKTTLHCRQVSFIEYSSTIQYMCVFVCVSSHSFWTSMDVPAGVTQEEGNTGVSIHLLSAVLALFFLARGIQPFLSLVDREVEFCVLTI